MDQDYHKLWNIDNAVQNANVIYEIMCYGEKQVVMFHYAFLEFSKWTEEQNKKPEGS
jgi:hypothetical protein